MPEATDSNTVQSPLAAGGIATLAAVAFIWSGMVLGVPFLATSAKFLAPSLSLPVALDVGRHTFGIFLGVEIALALLVVALLVLHRPGRLLDMLAGVPCAIVALDALWLRPALDARVQVILDGGMPEPAHLHSLYIGLEFLKLLALIALGTVALMRLCATARRRRSVG